MGRMMNGIDPRPMQVTVHFRTRGSSRLLESWRSNNLDTAQVLLMTKPGMITEASPCQTKVSRNALLGELSALWLECSVAVTFFSFATDARATE